MRFRSSVSLSLAIVPGLRYMRWEASLARLPVGRIMVWVGVG